MELARKDVRQAQTITPKAGVLMKSADPAERCLKVVQEQRGPKRELATVYGAKRMEDDSPFED
jgi:hypothetical protein